MSYYENTGDMTVSKFKGYLECPARQQAIDKGEYKLSIPAFDEGKYIEEMVIGDKNPEALDIKLWKNSKARYKKYDDFDARIEGISKKFLEKLKGKKQIEIHYKIDGIPWKGLIDVITPEGEIVDFKAMRESLLTKKWNEKYNDKVPNYVSFGYHYQLAAYTYGTESMDKGASLANFIKTSDYSETEIITLSPRVLEEALNEIRNYNERVFEMFKSEKKLKGCGTCEYCRSTKPHKELNVDISYYIYKEI